MKITKFLAAPTGITLALILAACTNNPGAHSGPSESKKADDAGQMVHVTIGEGTCLADPATMPAGKVTFEIKNEGKDPNEFEVLTENKLQIASEKENIGPGTTTSLTTTLKEGTYHTACKPNMVGDFVGMAKFEVTPGSGGEVSEDQKEAEKKAIDNYTAYVKDQVGELLTATKDFTQAYVDGNIQRARELYAVARQRYERIEPTAEDFGIEEAGDLDAALDSRVQDLAHDANKEPWSPEVLEGWTGWHRIEADLFSAPNSHYSFASQQERQAAADNLNETTQKLYDLVFGKIDGKKGKFELALSDVATGAAELLEEVGESKIVGEEETFSHTDLYDFKANVEGAEVAYGSVADIVKSKDKDLAEKIEKGFKTVNELLEKHVSGKDSDGNVTYVDYRTIAKVQEAAEEAPKPEDYTEEQKKLSDAVNALSEPLSKVAGTIL